MGRDQRASRPPVQQLTRRQAEPHLRATFAPRLPALLAPVEHRSAAVGRPNARPHSPPPTPYRAPRADPAVTGTHDTAQQVAEQAPRGPGQDNVASRWDRRQSRPLQHGSRCDGNLECTRQDGNDRHDPTKRWILLVGGQPDNHGRPAFLEGLQQLDRVGEAGAAASQDGQPGLLRYEIASSRTGLEKSSQAGLPRIRGAVGINIYHQRSSCGRRQAERRYGRQQAIHRGSHVQQGQDNSDLVRRTYGFSPPPTTPCQRRRSVR